MESDDNALLRHTHFVSWTLEVLRLRMLELEVVPEHGLISDVVEFILGKVENSDNFMVRFFIFGFT